MLMVWFQKDRPHSWTRTRMAYVILTSLLHFSRRPKSCICIRHNLYFVSPCKMRSSRLARLTYARPSIRLAFTRPARILQSQSVGSLELRASTLNSIRQLASLATEPVHAQTSEALERQPAVPYNITPVTLQLQVEAIDELLRSGIGGSDVWTARLQGVKDDLRTKRSRRIASKLSSCLRTLMISRRRRNLWSKRCCIFAIAGPYIGHPSESTSSASSSHRHSEEPS
jgi:hypothetical protein